MFIGFKMFKFHGVKVYGVYVSRCLGFMEFRFIVFRFHVV